MARLPITGADEGTWGSILNDYLRQTHNEDGTLKDDSVGASQLQVNSVTGPAIAGGSVAESKLDANVQTKLNQTAPVNSVNTHTGDITLTKTDIGLGNVDNTSDTNKPVSTAQQTALNNKQNADSDLTAIAALSPSNDDVIQRKAGAWTNRTAVQLATDLESAALDARYLSPPLSAGVYVWTSGPFATSTSAILGNGTLRLVPWWVPRAITIVRIGAEITAVGEAGSKLRLGIYNDNGSCFPGTLLLDAGQIAGDSATVQELTISQALAPGLYWVGGAVQAAPTTQPTVRVPNQWTPPVWMATGTSMPAANNTIIGYSQGSVSGALPANFTTSIGTAGTAPRVFVRTL